MALNPSHALGQRLARRRAEGAPPLRSAWIGYPEPLLAEAFALGGYDAVLFDRQHGAIDEAALNRALPLVAAAGVPAAVRLSPEDWAGVSRALDAGAAAVVASMIEGPEDAARLVAATKYPPLGRRSWGPFAGQRLSGLGRDDYLATGNAIGLAIAMIETSAALDSLDEILRVPGLDGVLVGPSDLSIALTGGRLDPAGPEVEAALARVLAAAHEADKSAWVYAHASDRMAALVAMGFDVVAGPSDGTILRDAIKASLAG